MRRFLIVGISVLMGSILPFSAKAQVFKSSDVAGLITVEDESKAVVLFVDGALQEVRGLPAQVAELSPSCHLVYKTGEKTYYFQSEEILERFKACKDLQKTACERTARKREERGKGIESSRRGMNDLFDEHRQRLFGQELERRMAEVSSQHPLLKVTAQESLDAHMQYLDRHGKKELLNYFKSHYATSQIGFINLSADHAEENGYILPTLTRFINKLENRNPKVYRKLGSLVTEVDAARRNVGEERKISKNISKIYDLLFEHLSEEELRAFVQEFSVAPYEVLNGEIEGGLRSRSGSIPQELVASAETLFYPSNKKEYLVNLFNDVKQRMIHLVQQTATQTGTEISMASSILNDVQLYWPLDKMGEEGFTGNYLSSMVTTENATYSPESNRIKINAPFLDAPRWQVIWALAHEIGHSIDPNREHSPSFWNHLQKCFKDQGFEEHHMGEIFSDWVAAEIIAQTLESQVPPLSEEEKRTAVFDSIWLCEADENEKAIHFATGKPDPHPAHPRRINKIMRSHPYVNKLLGCSSSPPYCSGDQP